MIQRVQSIYIGLFLVLNILLLFNVSIIEYVGTGNVKEPIALKIAALKFQISGQLNLNDAGSNFYSHDFKEKDLIRFDAETQKISGSVWSPLLLAQLVLIVLGFITLLSFKKLKRQLRIARLTLFLTFCYVALIMFVSYFAMPFAEKILDIVPLSELVVDRHIKIGYYMICALFPLIFLAQLGIKRDYNLIKSLDRLR